MMRRKQVFLLVVLGLVWSCGQSLANAQETPLHKAAAAGDKELVVRLLAEGAEVNAKDKDGQTPLHFAAKKGHLDVAELLLSKGADVNAKEQDGDTPLHGVAPFGEEELAELLLAKGADVNAMGAMGSTPLHLAAFMGRKELAELLLAKGAEVNARRKDDGVTPLHSTALGSIVTNRTYSPTSVRPVDYDVALNVMKVLVWTGQDPAGLRNWKPVAELLLAKGAEVDAKSKEGRTPLHYAALGDRMELAELLLAKGADVNVKDNDGKTPLKLAKSGEMKGLLRKYRAK
jgi:cytohesin